MGRQNLYMEQDCIEDGPMIVYRVVGHRIVNEKVRKAEALALVRVCYSLFRPFVNA